MTRSAASIALLCIVVPFAATGEPTQTVHGQILAPASVNCAYLESIVVTATGRQSVFEHAFAIDPDTTGAPFLLTADLPTGDLEISFWGEDQTFVSYATPGLEERGIVPAGAIRASVCLTAGVATDFTYTAG